MVIDDKRYIIYNSNFMKIANEISNNSWSSISILAHEIGHHLQGHTLNNNGSRPAIELEADKFSGFVLGAVTAGRSTGSHLDNLRAFVWLKLLHFIS